MNRPRGGLYIYIYKGKERVDPDIKSVIMEKGRKMDKAYII